MHLKVVYVGHIYDDFKHARQDQEESEVECHHVELERFVDSLDIRIIIYYLKV